MRPTSSPRPARLRRPKIFAGRLSPARLEPMYATIGTDVPQGDDWTFEPKYDGIRVLAFATSSGVRLVTRNG